MSQPRLLLLDEPLAGLDSVLAARIVDYVCRVQEHFSIPAILCSHDLDLIEGVSDEIITIKDGALERLK